MIEVIRHGAKPMNGPTKYRITCYDCGCIFQCDRSDFESAERCINGRVFIHCPDCNSFLGLRQQDMIVIEVE